MNLKSILGTLVLVAFLTGTASANEDAANSININEADAETLSEALEGVGTVKANAIVEFREEEGDFVTPEHLEEVSGIGAATIETNRDRIRLD